MNYTVFLISIFSLLSIISCTSKQPSSSSVTSKTGITENNSEQIPKAQITKANEIIAVTSMKEIKAIEARKIFNLNCTTCHGTKGNMKMNGAKDLTISSLTKVEQVAKIYHGKALMTPFKGVLTDAEIVAVAEYVEQFKK